MKVEYTRLAYDIALNVTRHEAEEVDNASSWVKQTMAAMRTEKLTGLVVPEPKGGIGAGLTGLVKVCEILGRESGSAGLCFGMHCVGSAVIAAKATPEQDELFLQPIVQGKHITSLALSEPGTGAHFYYPQTSLQSNGSEYVVNGEKTFVTNGNHADSYVISTMATDPDASPDLFSCLVVPNNAPGLTWKGKWEGLGMRGNSSIGVKLQDVRVPKNHLIGEEGDQIWYIFNVVTPYFLMAMAGTYLGIASRALEEATNHISKRVYSHSGSRLADNSIIQYKLGRLWTRVESSRRLIYYAAQQGDIGEAEAIPAILSAKADVADCVVEVVNDAMTLCGGIAYRDSHIFNRLLRDARAVHVMAPTTDILNVWLGRALLSQPILGE